VSAAEPPESQPSKRWAQTCQASYLTVVHGIYVHLITLHPAVVWTSGAPTYVKIYRCRCVASNGPQACHIGEDNGDGYFRSYWSNISSLSNASLRRSRSTTCNCIRTWGLRVEARALKVHAGFCVTCYTDHRVPMLLLRILRAALYFEWRVEWRELPRVLQERRFKI
jgi:hypothetical protein